MQRSTAAHLAFCESCPRHFPLHAHRRFAASLRSVIALAPMPFVAYLSTRLMKFRRRAGERGRKMAEKSVAGTMDMITNIKTVRGFAMESEEAQRYESSIVLQAALNQATAFITESAMHFFMVL